MATVVGRLTLDLLLACLGVATRAIEKLLFVGVSWYDAYMYSPLQTALWPVVMRVPRTADIRGEEYVVFSANIVSWCRTLLVVPIALCLKFNLCWTAFGLVFFHDFLDHLDGIVAKVQRQTLGPVDDPLLGGFMDAFCDKIVNVTVLWSILLVTEFSGMTWVQLALFTTPCVVIIVYEFILGVVRVQDYFQAYYYRKFKKSDEISGNSTASVMEGKLKEKLESMGIAFICLAQSNPVVTGSYSGIAGLICLALSVRLAHASLSAKLDARKQKPKTIQEAKLFEVNDEKKEEAHEEEREGELEKEKGQDKENVMT